MKEKDSDHQLDMAIQYSCLLGTLGVILLAVLGRLDTTSGRLCFLGSAFAGFFLAGYWPFGKRGG